MDPNVPGSSNTPANPDHFARNPDGTIPDHALVPVDPSHLAAAKALGDASTGDATDDARDDAQS